MADDNSIELPAKRKSSDLPKRAASALVMLAVAAAAFWLGGVVLATFIWLVALVGFGECVMLVPKATGSLPWRIAGIVVAAAYFAFHKF